MRTDTNERLWSNTNVKYSHENMASPTEVKTYLAHWFQLMKKIKSDNGRLSYQPERVIQGEHFSHLGQIKDRLDSLIALVKSSRKEPYYGH